MLSKVFYSLSASTAFFSSAHTISPPVPFIYDKYVWYGVEERYTMEGVYNWWNNTPWKLPWWDPNHRLLQALTTCAISPTENKRIDYGAN